MFVLMNTKTKVLMHSYRYKNSYTHKGHAVNAALKHSNSPFAKEHGIEYVAIDYDLYQRHYGNMTKKVMNLMSGKEVEISINTPLCCDVSSETYWSM